MTLNQTKLIKKVIYSISFLLSFQITALTQQLTIKGQVVDSLKTDSNSLEFATLQLVNINNSKISSALTGEKGIFTIKSLEKGNYILKVKYLGYTDKKVSLNISKDTTVMVALSPSSQLLEEIKVKGEKALIEVKADRLVYNISQEKEKGNLLEDIIIKAPFVTIANDQFQVKGSSNIKILIDGRETIMSFNELKSLASSKLKSIEVITFPSSKYDGNVESVINIIRNPLPTNFLGGGSYFGLGSRTSNTGLTINYQKNKLYISSFLGVSYSRVLGGSDFIRNNTNTTSNYKLEQVEENININPSLNYSFSLDKEYSKSRAFSTAFNFSIDNNKVDNDILAITSNKSDVSKLSYKNKNEANSVSVGVNLNYSKIFKPKKSFNISTLFQISPSKSMLNSTVSPSDRTLVNINENTNSEFTSIFDFSNTSNAKLGFETGTKFIVRNFDGKSSYNGSEFLKNLDYSQLISANYLSLLKTVSKKVNMRVGARLEYTRNMALNFTNTDLSLLPNLLFSLKESDSQSTTLVYAKRIQRPGLLFLNSFVDVSDPNNIRVGNQELKPEFTHTITLSHNSIGKSVTFSPSIYFRKGVDLIAALRTLNQSVATIQFQNIANSSTIGSDLFLGINASKNVYVSLSGGLRTVSISSPIQQREAFIYTFNTNLSWKASDKIRLEGYTTFQSGGVSLQGESGNNYFMSFAGRYLLSKNSSLKLTIENPIFNEINTPIFFDGDSFSSTGNRFYFGRAIQLRYIYSFGKDIQVKKQTKDVKNVDVKTEE